jgi:hypothetical protein
MEQDIIFSLAWLCGIYFAYNIGYIKGYEKHFDVSGEYDPDDIYESGFSDGMSYAITERTDDLDV